MKNNKIKLIIFDAYGVILNGGYPQTCKALAKKHHRDWLEIYEIIYKKYFNMAAERKISQKDAWILAAKELNLSADWRAVRDLHYSFMSVNKNIAKFIGAIDKNIITLLLSKNTRSQFNDAEKFMGFKKYFKYVINTWELNLPKASKKTMQHILNKFKLKPFEVLYIDDQKENLIEAKKMGINTIFYKDFKNFKEKILKIL